jgi:hypothetical protein
MHVLTAAATPLFDLGASIQAAVDQVTAQVGASLPIVLPIAGGLLAIGIGWKFAKRFIKG